MLHRNPQKGFTLIELSLVIIVIGLIFSAISAGTSLVETSRIMRQVTDLRKYEIAYNAFKMTYDAIPGDFNKATDYWTSSLNGDGNGRISNGGDQLFDQTEAYIFFDHLSRAELIEENFDANLEGLNISYPSLKINPGAGMYVANNAVQLFPGSQQLSDAEGKKLYKAGLHLEISRPEQSNENARNDGVGVASPGIMHKIDVKIDDGIARQGRYKSFRLMPGATNFGNCLTGTDGDYLLSNPLIACFSEYILEDY